MGEREPTVIERMAKARRIASGASFLKTGDMTADEVDTELMLAAVRELQNILSAHDRISAVADLRDIISDHERRQGESSMPDSPAHSEPDPG